MTVAEAVSRHDRRIRSVGWTELFLVVIAFTCASARAGETSLDDLLADYQAYGLPLPASTSYLAIKEEVQGTINGVEQRDHYLVLVVKTDRAGRPAAYLAGTRTVDIEELRRYERVAPDAGLTLKTTPCRVSDVYSEFRTEPDLALAVQCKAAGWTELARTLLRRSRSPSAANPFDRVKAPPLDDRAALAQLAWNHWCNEFASSAQRRVVVERLKRIQAGPFGLNSRDRRNILADMEATLAQPQKAPAGLEADVEKLLDLEEDRWQGWGGDKHLRKLRSEGAAAVPSLLAHIDDFRMTRSINADPKRGYAWHVRIADVVAKLLKEIAAQEFAYDFLERDGRGVRVDRDHVNYW